jgi:sn-glycerol 3-phosphate transport system substrate-binding protein
VHRICCKVFEVGTATMMAAKGAIVPVYKVMADAKQPFDPKVYLPAVAGYYTDSKGNMLSFPFNSSTVVYYINKDAFKKAGLNPDQAPKTGRRCLRPPRSSRLRVRNASTPPAGRRGCTSRT